MDDEVRKMEIIPNFFEVPSTSDEFVQTRKTDCSIRSRNRTRIFGGKIRNPGSMLKLINLRGLSLSSDLGDGKMEISATQLESLRTKIEEAEEREAHLNARLEHVDEILRSARLAGYLHVRSRWSQLPGEPPILDDGEVDDWLPRFVVLSDSCLFFYLRSTDLSPQDSTLLSEITEVGSLPEIVRYDREFWQGLYILTRHGHRFECSSRSTAQVLSWLTVLREDCMGKIPP